MTSPIGVVSFNEVIPDHPTLKYAQLGILNHQRIERWCNRHGYAFYSQTPRLDGIPACWGKFDQILNALEHHEWVLWVDSDAAPVDLNGDIAALLSSSSHMIFQSPGLWFIALRQDPNIGFRLRPWNTGIFLVRNTQWSKNILAKAAKLAPQKPTGSPWNGVGDQEALTMVLHSNQAEEKVGFVDGLQDPPQDFRGSRFVHFYGDRGRYWLDADTCCLCIGKLHQSLGPNMRPIEFGVLHWCSLQNLTPNEGLERGGPERFGYDRAELAIELKQILSAPLCS